MELHIITIVELHIITIGTGRPGPTYKPFSIGQLLGLNVPELKPITRAAKHRPFMAYDMEWYPSDPARAAAEGVEPLKLRLVGVYDGSNYRSYSNIEGFLRGELTRKNRGMWLYAHAGGSFDLRYILEWLVDNPQPGLSISCAFKGSSAVIVELKRGRNSWYLLDSFFLIRQSLRKIGEWLGLEKGGSADYCPKCGDNCICMFYAPLPELREYNERDCRLLYDAIAEFERIVLELGGQLEMTVAATAMALFRRQYLHQTIPTCQAQNETARLAYVASRVEVYSQTVFNADYYDINSSFPHAMTQPAPGRYLGSTRGTPWRKDAIYIARARVRVPPGCYIPPLPFRSKSRRVFFPTGEWEAWFSNVDLEWLEECGGRIVAIYESQEYEPFYDLANYAAEIYELRKNAPTEAEKTVLKILLNSLYGKFAESPEKQQMVINPPLSFFEETTEDPEDGTGRPMRHEVIPGIFEYTELRYQAHVHVPISVHITALARRAISKYMVEAAAWEGGDVHYCDTDGFAVPTHVVFETSHDLGGLKLEKHIHEGTFAAAKLYAHRPGPEAEWTVRAKGFSKVLPHDKDGNPTSANARRFAYSDFCRLLEHKELPLSHFMKIRESLNSAHGGDPTGILSPKEIVRRKAFRNVARPKRKFAADGRTSAPWDVEAIRND